MEPEQPRVSYRATDFHVKAPRLGANADHGITQLRRNRFFFSGKRMKARQDSDFHRAAILLFQGGQNLLLVFQDLVER
jgi:hypothetical protein